MEVDHMDNQEQCRHEGCNCSVPSGQEFCSEHCRKAARSGPTREEDRRACACGHDQCTDKQ